MVLRHQNGFAKLAARTGTVGLLAWMHRADAKQRPDRRSRVRG
jgi:hypothetical protein